MDFSIVQMPPSIPVACMSIGKAGAKNAAILAIEILAIKDKTISEKLLQYRKEMEKQILSKATLTEVYMDISKDLYKTGDIILLSSYMFDTYESYYKYFQVFGVDKDEFLRIIKKIIERTRNFYNSEDKNYFKKC